MAAFSTQHVVIAQARDDLIRRMMGWQSAAHYTWEAELAADGHMSVAMAGKGTHTGGAPWWSRVGCVRGSLAGSPSGLSNRGGGQNGREVRRRIARFGGRGERLAAPQV